MFFIPESPRWLILQNRFDDGVRALERVRPAGSDVRAEADEIKAAIDKERETASKVGVWDMFKDPVDRRRTILSVCAVTLQAATGSMFIIGESPRPFYAGFQEGGNVGGSSDPFAAYKAYFFTMANVDDPFAMTNVLSTLGLVAIITNSIIVVRWGRRRRMLIGGLMGCAVLQLIIAVVYDKKPGQTSTGKVLVALSSLYMMVYNVSDHPKLYLPPEFVIPLTGLCSVGNGGHVRLARRRRDPLAAPAELHVRPRRRHRLPRRVGDDLHGAVLHQPGVAQLGAQVRLHLVPLGRRLRRVGMVLPAGAQGPDARGD